MFYHCSTAIVLPCSHCFATFICPDLPRRLPIHILLIRKHFLPTPQTRNLIGVSLRHGSITSQASKEEVWDALQADSDLNLIILESWEYVLYRSIYRLHPYIVPDVFINNDEPVGFKVAQVPIATPVRNRDHQPEVRSPSSPEIGLRAEEPSQVLQEGIAAPKEAPPVRVVQHKCWFGGLTQRQAGYTFYCKCVSVQVFYRDV